MSEGVAIAREDRAWGAGFLDGEGCFFNAGPTAGFSIAQVDKSLLEKFQRSVHTGKINGPYSPRAGKYNKREQWWFQAYGSDAVVVAQQLWPWLGPTKQAAALRAFARDPLRRQEGPFLHWATQRTSRPQSRRENLAWAAGFMDAEGCFSRGKVANYRCVAITQTERGPLDRFKEIVGIGRVLGPYRQGTNDGYHRKPVYFYRASTFEQTQAIAAVLWFKLGTAKKNQAIAVLEGYAFCKRGHHKTGRSRGCSTCLSDYWRQRRERGDFVREPAALYDAPPWPWHDEAPRAALAV